MKAIPDGGAQVENGQRDGRYGPGAMHLWTTTSAGRNVGVSWNRVVAVATDPLFALLTIRCSTRPCPADRSGEELATSWPGALVGLRVGQHPGLGAAGIESPQYVVGDLRIATRLVSGGDHLLPRGCEEFGF